MMRFLLVLVCVLALAAFGCGSTSEGESTTPVDESTEEPATPPPAVSMAVTKTLSTEAVLLGDTVSVEIKVTNLGKQLFWVTVQENFVPGVAYIGLEAKQDQYENLIVRYYNWVASIPPLATHTISFDIKPQRLGYVSPAPTLVLAGSTVKKAITPPCVGW